MQYEYSTISFAILIIAVYPAFAQEDSTVFIPDWITNNARLWANGEIDDRTFVGGMQYLISQEIMRISLPSQETDRDSNVIPIWVRNNAGWWSEGMISDEEFASSMQFLIANNIIKNTEQEDSFLFYNFAMEKTLTKKGETITWTSNDHTPHTITSGSPSTGIDLFNSGILLKGEKVSYTFEKDGQYSFFCMLHPWETSTLTIPANIESYKKPTPSFVDPNKDPFHYISRYLNEPEYKNWFTTNYPDYTIYEAVGLSESEYLEFTESEKENTAKLSLKIQEDSGELAEQKAQKIVYEYGGYFTAQVNNEELKIILDYMQEFFIKHKDKFDPDITNSIPWTDYQHSEEIIDSFLDTAELKDEFYKEYVAKWKEVFKNRLELIDELHTQGVEKIQDLENLDEPKKNYYIRELDKKKEISENFITSTAASLLEPLEEKARIAQNQQRIKDELKQETETFGGGCLIATAAYGSEMAPQIQMLREIRDSSLLKTTSGMTFMAGFNQLYYLISPTIADWERENPAFKEIVKTVITPMLSTLLIFDHVDIDSEEEVLVYGIGIIMLNIGMYFGLPVIAISGLQKIKLKLNRSVKTITD